MEKYYKIAGLTVKMDTYGRAEAQAEAYRCEPSAQIDFQVCSRWLEFKDRHPEMSDEVGEYLYSGANFYRNLLDFGGMMLHSSAVVVDGKAYLFTADPGTGKSTHTKLWLEQFGDRAYILNDDKPAIRKEEDGWFAYGTPWSGKYDISVDARAPVAGIAVLERGAENAICPFGGIPAIHAILRQCNRPKAAEYREKLLNLLDQLISQVPIWKLQCTISPEAAQIAYAAMCPKEENERKNG